MGTNFFRSTMDPLGSAIAGNAPNSGLGRAINNDPVNNFLFGSRPKYVAPTAGPWAGVAPTLAASQSGYGLTNGNPALGGGGNSAQLQATFGSKVPM